MSTNQFQVSGMTCAHCVGAVTEEVSALPGVEAVQVDLVPDGTSTLTVTSTTPLEESAVAAAVDEAGYELVR
ncbi:heavy-metal-associated domain-containing protein [Kineococcus sp. TBRC 1896]|uniref:Heavy-metal-associated domain-containing protein n=1 Tax=Kineococcus mangrovi TaxID=1660183 RepID=A0ABV4I0A9_9ACTN